MQNISGAGGTVGSTRAMRADPDGYTILMGQMGTHAASVALYPNLAYKPDVDFEPIGMVTAFPLIIAARKDLPPQNLREFISYAKANYGKLNQAHAGVGSIFFTTCLLLNSILEVTPTPVPFGGGAPAMNALVGGQVDYMCADIITGGPHLESGKIKVYAIASAARNPAMPSVPTTVEAGLPEFQVSAWNGLFAPKATPRPLIDKLADALDKALDDEVTRKRMLVLGCDIPDKSKTRPAAVSRIGQERDRALDADHSGCKSQSGVNAVHRSSLATAIGGARMPPEKETIATLENWLAQFEMALGQPDSALLSTLFHADSHWRDVLALTWQIRTISGLDAILGELKAHVGRANPTGFRTDPRRTAPRHVKRAGASAIEAIFRFETADGHGTGVLRLTPAANNANTLKAWTLLTALNEIKGFEDQVMRSRPHGKSYARDFRGPNWLDLRNAAAEYADRDPAVLVVGGGQAGLSIAARLTQLQVDTLIVDREQRIGDNWRNRYHALTLHNQVQVNHLPYMLFPPSWPTYIPKDKLAAWFEAYVESMELNYWTATEFESGTYNHSEGRWSVVLRRADGTKREMHPRHVVMATGVSGIPSFPDIPTLRNFGGRILHASQYDDGEAWKGKRALVIGTGNSGHDIAQDLHASGAKVTLVQRSSTLIVNVEPSAQLPYALYDEGLPLEDCDLIATSIPLHLARKSHILFTQQAKELDSELLEGLERVGFKLDFGEDGTGWQFKYLTRGGGYYFNVGCSDLIVEGQIALVQFSDIAGFVADGAQMCNGETLAADLIVLATGYKGQEYLVRKLFGDDVAERVGPIWGFGDEQELRNMFTRTAQQGLWFIAGSLAQCRIYSRYLGLQIKACEEGLLS